MREDEFSLAKDRTTRNAARGVFDAHLARLKGDVDAHGGVAGKVKDEAGQRLLDAGKQGLEIVKESKGIVAGAVAALALWLLRKPLIDAAKGWFDKSGEPDDVQES